MIKADDFVIFESPNGDGYDLEFIEPYVGQTGRIVTVVATGLLYLVGFKDGQLIALETDELVKIEEEDAIC